MTVEEENQISVFEIRSFKEKSNQNIPGDQKIQRK